MIKYQTKFIEHSKVDIINRTGKKHIALIAGGMSAEREVSLNSAKGIMRALLDAGYQVTFIDMGADIASVLASIKPDIVFNCLHGTYGEDGCLPGLLNIMRIPYTHSGLLASSIGFNKLKSKELFIANNIKTAKSITVNKADNIKDDPFPRPYVIKPLAQGSSIGVEVIFEEDDFSFANYDFPYGDQVLIEKYIEGREINVAVLNGKALGALEIKVLKRKFNDYETKYTEGYAQHIIPVPIEEKLHNKLLRDAEKANDVIGCRGLVRVEFIYNESEQEFYILELNTHPGMTPLSICPDIAAYHGMNFMKLIEEVLATAVFEE